jgi:hypothetical protein
MMIKRKYLKIKSRKSSNKTSKFGVNKSSKYEQIPNNI